MEIGYRQSRTYPQEFRVLGVYPDASKSVNPKQSFRKQPGKPAPSAQKQNGKPNSQGAHNPFRQFNLRLEKENVNGYF